MCWKEKCTECGGVSWGGCGKHLENTFAGVKNDDRCWCGYEQAEREAAIKAAIGNGPFPKGAKACAAIKAAKAAAAPATASAAAPPAAAQ